MAIFIKENGVVAEVKPQNGKTFSLEELQYFVKGYIEIIMVGEKLMVLNEEGKLYDYDINLTATEIFQKYYGNTDVIVGCVLLADNDELD